MGLHLKVGPTWNKPQPFDRAHHAANLTCPLLVIHGDHDPISPLADGQEIAAAAKQSRLFIVLDGEHHGLWSNPDSARRCTDEVSVFLTSVVPTRLVHTIAP